jgi:dGTPase
LLQYYNKANTWDNLKEEKEYYPVLIDSFEKWLAQYCDKSIVPEDLKKIAEQCENYKIYGMLDNEQIYIQAIIDYISGMTDRFAVKAFNELITY